MAKAEDGPSASSALGVPRELPARHLERPDSTPGPQARLPERPARPRRAHVDDGVRLDVVHVRVPEPQLFAASLGGTDDPGGDCVLKGKRASDGDHELSWPQLRGAAKQQDRQPSLEPQGGRRCGQ